MPKLISYQSCPCQPIRGNFSLPSDKSISHRALLLSSIAEGVSTLHHVLMGADNRALLTALRSMGVKIRRLNKDTHRVQGVGLLGLSPPKQALDLGNSATALRLLAGILVAQPFQSCLMGDDSLNRRPMQRIVDPLRKMGARIQMSDQNTPPLFISPTKELRCLSYTLPMASAQVKSCLLLAGLYAQGKTCLDESVPTRDHTEIMLNAMGYPVSYENQQICLKGGGCLTGRTLDIPSDISSAAFFMVAASIIPNSNITLTRVGVNPRRVGVITILKSMGAHITLFNRRLVSHELVADVGVRFSRLRGIDIPVDQVPLAIDELPIILIAAAFAKGKTQLRGAEELRVKESDRIVAMAEGLRRLGIVVNVYDDGMSVEGGTLNGGEVDSFGDHRIAMSFLMAGSAAQGPVTVYNCNTIDTSFPDFESIAYRIGLVIVKH